MKALILQAIHEAPWAILTESLAGILARVEKISGLPSPESAARPSTQRQQGSVAVLTLAGPIFPRGGWIADLLGLTSLQAFGAQFRTAVNDPNVSAIVIDVDSPGGSVAGVDEMAGEVYRARGAKPIVAVANHMAASAAYWLASSADRLIVAPSGEVGSIGVFAAHIDYSKALDEQGVKPTLISAGKYKTEANPYEPLTDEARAAIQARVDDYYGMFVKTVARGRGVSVDDVRGGFGEGRMVGAREAVKFGMADEVGTLADAIAAAGAMMRGKPGRAAAADLEFRQRRARAVIE